MAYGAVPRAVPGFSVETAQISSSAPKLVQEIENRLIEEEWLIKAWSPVHLRNLLEKYYFTNGTHQVSAVKVWQDACQYLYMPRLVNDQVLRGTIEEAVKSDDFFAFAAGNVKNVTKDLPLVVRLRFFLMRIVCS